MDNSEPITTGEMREHVDAGTAVPLLPPGVPGPVHHQGQWWACPEGTHAYQLVNTEQAALLDELAHRLATAAAAAHPPASRGDA